MAEFFSVGHFPDFFNFVDNVHRPQAGAQLKLTSQEKALAKARKPPRQKTRMIPILESIPRSVPGGTSSQTSAFSRSSSFVIPARGYGQAAQAMGGCSSKASPIGSRQGRS